MPVSTAQQDFLTFVEEYTQFLEHMTVDESEKLSALGSRDLERIERSIAVSQANAKRLENYELKRIDQQARAGYGGLTFPQLVEKADPAEQGRLRQLFGRFERSVKEIRFRNDKSMAVAKDNMMSVDPEAVLPGAGAKAQNPYARFKEEEAAANNILEKKV